MDHCAPALTSESTFSSNPQSLRKTSLPGAALWFQGWDSSCEKLRTSGALLNTPNFLNIQEKNSKVDYQRIDISYIGVACVLCAQACIRVW